MLSEAALFETNELPASSVTIAPLRTRKRRHPIATPRRRMNIDLDLSKVKNASNPSEPSSPVSDDIASTSDDESSQNGIDPVPKKQRTVTEASLVCSANGATLMELADVDSSISLTYNGSTVSSKRTDVERDQKFLDPHNEFEFIGDFVVDRGSVECNVYEFKRLDVKEYKRFMNIAVRMQAAAAHFEPSEYRRLKAKVIPEDTRIVYSTNRQPYLLTPFHGGSLDTYVKKRGNDFGEKDVQLVIKQVLEILDICHSVNLFLCDFKISKFVFGDKDHNQLRLLSPLSLKLSESINDNRLNIRAASLMFLAPETLSKSCSDGYSGSASDLWALGVMTFALLMNRYPFNGESPNMLIERIRVRCFCAELSCNVSVIAKTFVYGLLSLKPQDRASARRWRQSSWMTLDYESVCKLSQRRSFHFHNFQVLTQVPGLRIPRGNAFEDQVYIGTLQRI